MREELVSAVIVMIAGLARKIIRHYKKLQITYFLETIIWSLRPASRNMVRQHGSESQNHSPPFQYGLVVYSLKVIFHTNIYVYTQCRVHFFPSHGKLFPV